jgi:hypothetical protein
MRAIPILRRQLEHKDPRQRRLAALGLATLGDGSVEPLARSWLGASVAGKGTKPHGADVRAGSEVLLLLGSPGAGASIAKLLGATDTRAAGLALALRAPSVTLVPALRAVVEGSTSTASEREQAAQALTRVGTDEAAGVLLRLLARPELATLAAFGLGTSPSSAARLGLEQALRSAARGAPQRLVLRAGIVRWVQHGEELAGLVAALESALGSKDPTDRALGSLGVALLGRQPIEPLLGSADRAVAVAAAGAATGLGGDALRGCVARVSAAAEQAERAPRTSDGRAADLPLEAVACGTSLLSDASSGVSSTVLARWAEAGGPVAPLAAMALARRDPLPLRGRLEGLLQGTDPLVRAHVAFGLGRSPQPDAVSLLVAAYRFEADAVSRRALVRALSTRAEPERLRTLKLARDLDPDGEVRSLASSALAGHDLGPRLPPVGSEGLSLVPVGEADRSRVGERAARLVRADGLALPVVSAPDGVLLAPGLGRVGEVSATLAPAAMPGDATP